ncbi:MAG: hypothetical protein U9P42_09365 [Candidatus Fermentibacteria bacterium]|nr:hypothetical protein [Candidatus Fermentibacteria bacterium]
MRYFVVFILAIVIAGTAFAQEDAPGEEEITYAAIEPEDRATPNGRDMGAIRIKINEVREVIQEDYEVLLASDPEASGTISISFSITAQGTVTDASVDCPEALATLQEDVLAKLESLEFGIASEQTEDIPVTVPFNLTPPQ